MKSVTEFANFTLSAALKVRETLIAQGKSPEEIQESLGGTYKLEGEKLAHFIRALDVASQNAENLKRVFVVSLNEGERAPAKAVQVEAFHYYPEFHVTAKPAHTDKKGGKGRQGGKGRGGDRGEKESPWGLSPEQKEAKKKAQAAAAAEKRKQP